MITVRLNKQVQSKNYGIKENFDKSETLILIEFELSFQSETIRVRLRSTRTRIDSDLFGLNWDESN